MFKLIEEEVNISQSESNVSTKNLGVHCTEEETHFHFWVKDAEDVRVKLAEDEESLPVKTLHLYHEEAEYWHFKLLGDLHGTYYWLEIRRGDKIYKTVDPWSKAVATNSKRSIIVDTARTDPPGWKDDARPEIESAVESVIYEVHVRDFSSHEQSGLQHRGKYLAFTEKNSTNEAGHSTGLDHLKDLGITHVQLLPIFDFASVDDTDPKDYNWGYDPYCYNSPEGSYATDPSSLSRITELKKLIMSLHSENIGVIMDVVYNHTYHTDHSPLNLLAPDYFYRWESADEVANGSGVGNELATEREKVREFIIQSVSYWAEEYHLDGFRFDLMGLIDRETMLKVRNRLDEIDDSILIYGEPWYALPPNLDKDKLMVKGAQRSKRIGVFNDEYREAIKGDNDGPVPGFITGKKGLEHEIKKGVVGHIPYAEDLMGLADEPNETINYLSCHDNLTLWDKLKKTCPESEEGRLIQLQRYAHAILFTSQGVAFMHGGSEFLRTKFGDHNSYQSGDRVNALKWDRKAEYYETYKYIRGLIELRREHPAFRLKTAAEIKKYLTFISTPEDVVGFHLGPHAGGDSWQDIVVIYNSRTDSPVIDLGKNRHWQQVVNDNRAGIEPLRTFHGRELEVAPQTAAVIYN